MQLNTKFSKFNGKVRSLELPPVELIHNDFPSGIFKAVVNETMMGRELYFEEQPKFSLPVNIYGDTEERFNRIITSFENTDKSLGVLLYGVSGSGKSLLAKYICNRVNIPTIIIDASTVEHLGQILNEVKTPAVYFLDEFEKMFEEPEHQNYLLTILDGTSNHKNLFLLTANEHDKINQFMLNRPSRIRYAWEYEGVEQEIIKSILLEHFDEEKTNDIVEATDRVNNLSYDILQEFINECKLFPEVEPKQLLKGFNVCVIEPDLKNYVWEVMVGGQTLAEFFNIDEFEVYPSLWGNLEDQVNSHAKSQDGGWGNLNFSGVEETERGTRRLSDVFYLDSPLENIKVTRDTITFETRILPNRVSHFTSDIKNSVADEHAELVERKVTELIEGPLKFIGRKITKWSL